MAIQNLRSSSAHKRPIPNVLSAGQIAVNTNQASPGLFFKDSNGDLVKVGPVHIGTSAPNSSPATTAADALVSGTVYQILTLGNTDFTAVGASANTVGVVFTATGAGTGTGTVSGQQGNEKGEQWLDTTGSAYDLKIYDGSAWRSQAGEFVNVTGDTMTGALGVEGNITSTGTVTANIFESTGRNEINLAADGTALAIQKAGSTVGNLGVEGTIYKIAAVGNSTGSIQFTTKIGGVTTPKLTIANSGNVGIGTTSPEEILHVAAASEIVSSRDGVMLQSTSSLAADTGLPVVFTSHIGNVANYGVASIAGRKENATSGNAAGYLQFATGSSGGAISEKVRIDSAGRLLVQSSSAPTQGIYSQYAPLTVQGYIGAPSGNGILNIARGVAAAGLSNNTDIGTLVFSDSAGGEFARISCFADAAPGSSDYPGRLSFHTTADGASSPTERMRISSSGGATFTADATIHSVTVGRGAGSVSTNTALGSSALLSNTTGTHNTACGTQALQENTTASASTALGSRALLYSTTGSNNTAVGYEAAFNNTTGSHGIAIGNQTLRSNTIGNYNVAIGSLALNTNTTGNNNVALGNAALYLNSNASNNVAIGDAALYSNTTSVNNTACGFQALNANTTGPENTAVGAYSLNVSTTGGYNVSIGAGSLLANTTGGFNTATGYNSLRTNTTGNYSVAVGYQSLFNSSTGSENTAVGTYALHHNTTASENTAVGYRNLVNLTTGAFNTGVGAHCAESLTTGSFNTAVGGDSLKSSTTGTQNAAFGVNSLRAATSGSYNTACGMNTLRFNITGHNNTACGSSSMETNTTGIYNSAFGTGSLFYNTTGGNNTACGYQALVSNTTASNNTAVGAQAGYSNTTGFDTTSLGYQALYTNTSGYQLVAVGNGALRANTSAVQNTAVGVSALGANTTASQNTGIGYIALEDCTTGYQNTATGSNALPNITSGIQNMSSGYASGTVLTTGSYNVYLGAFAQASAAGITYETVVGFNITGKGSNTAFISGTNGAYNGANSTAWSTTSDRRIKKNIVENNEGLSLINQIAVKNFEYKTAEEIEADGEVAVTDAVSKTGTQLGVIAQELQDVRSSWVTTRDNGTLALTGADEIVWHLVNAVKELSAKNTALEARLAALEAG